MLMSDWSSVVVSADRMPVPDNAIDGFVDPLNLKAIPRTQETRYGLVVHRADLRTFPTTTRLFSSDDDTDIDRFKESALFLRTTMAIVHESANKRGRFVVDERYAERTAKQEGTEGSKTQVFGYVRKVQYMVVNGAKVR